VDAVLVLVLGGLALGLGFGALTLVGNRRNAEPPFRAELPVPPEVRAAYLAAKDQEKAAAAAKGDPVAAPPAREPSSGDGDQDEPTGPRRPRSKAAGSSDASPRSLSPGSHVPLVDALVGLDLPCGLEFLGTVVPAPGTTEVLAFVTSEAGAHEVAQAFEEQLRRIDYELQPTGQEGRQVALREDASFIVEVHQPAGGVMRGKEQAFPTARAAAVVVEISRS
jgi:hypothetical protein